MFEELDGERLKRACDPADIKGSIDPRRSNSAWSELVDVRAGWYGAELTEKERTTLFLAHSLFWSQKEIAFNQGVTVQAISLRIRGGLQKIAAWINGDEIEEEEAWMN